MRGETFCAPSPTFTADSAETALISPVSFQSFLSNWKFGIQAAHVYHSSKTNSRCASPYASQSLGRRSSQQRTEETLFTEMDTVTVSRRDSDMQASDGASLPALHSSDSSSQRQRTQVNPPLLLQVLQLFLFLYTNKCHSTFYSLFCVCLLVLTSNR